jgi:DNA-binding NtrC family response regulator
MRSILVLDEDESFRKRSSEELTSAGYEVTTAADTQSGKDLVESCQPAMVVLNPYMDREAGFGLLEDVKRQYPDLPMVTIIPQNRVTDAAWLFKAEGFFKKSQDLDGLKKIAEELI